MSSAAHALIATRRTREHIVPLGSSLAVSLRSGPPRVSGRKSRTGGGVRTLGPANRGRGGRSWRVQIVAGGRDG
jgi:hypothetical protein